jgi:broad-specificity NMP kinase
MKKHILISGVPGSGKTTTYFSLKNTGQTSVDVESKSGVFALVDKVSGKELNERFVHPSAFEQADWICKKEKLLELFSQSPSEVTYYCMTASNIFDLVYLFDQAFYLYVDKPVLRKRLHDRGHFKFGYKKEEQEWICSWKDGWEVEIKRRGAERVDAFSSPSRVTQSILDHTQHILLE